MKYKGIMKTVAAVFSLSLVTCLLPSSVHADEPGFTKTAENTSVGTSGIGAPNSSTGLTPWTGNYVYYGKYNGNPVKYRVLDPNSTAFKDGKEENNPNTLNTLFLDCDSVLAKGRWGTNLNWGSNETYARKWMNETFLNGSGNFTTVEKAAIPVVFKEYSANVYREDYFLINLTNNEKVFPLDLSDIFNPEYGYGTSLLASSRVKGGADSTWWLRTRINSYTVGDADTYKVPYVTDVGRYSGKPVSETHGYSPAFNVLLDSILFSTKVNSNATEYKLTLKDTGFGIAVTEGSSLSIDGTTVTVPYTVTDNDTTLDPDTVSVLIKDANDDIKYYAPLTGTYAATGTGTFELPSYLTLKDWGTEYTVSILAEDVNGQYETDYASEPVEVAAPFADGFGEQLAGYSISLDGDIGVNFYMELDSTIVNSDSAYMEFALPNEETPKVYVKDVRSNPVSVNGKTYYVFKCNVAAKEMTAPITAQMKDGDKTGSPYSYTVRDYADYLLSHTQGNAEYAKAAPLVKAMLNYGACAQTYFNYNPNDLANSVLDSKDQFQNLDKTSIDNGINAPYDEDGTTLPTGVNFEGATLSLKSETSLSLYFTGLDAKTEFKCTGNMGEKKVETNTNGAYVIARIRGIKAEELKNDFTLTFGNGSSVKYNAMTYCYNVLHSDTASDKLKNVCRALYLYASAASPNG